MMHDVELAPYIQVLTSVLPFFLFTLGRRLNDLISSRLDTTTRRRLWTFYTAFCGEILMLFEKITLGIDHTMKAELETFEALIQLFESLISDKLPIIETPNLVVSTFLASAFSVQPNLFLLKKPTSYRHIQVPSF